MTGLPDDRPADARAASEPAAQDASDATAGPQGPAEPHRASDADYAAEIEAARSRPSRDGRELLPARGPAPEFIAEAWNPWRPLERREPEALASSRGATVEGVVARRSAADAILEELARQEAADAAGRPRRRKPQNEPGFVLHARPWSESSLVVDVLTPHFGRVFLVARGAKRPGSNLRGVLVPFSPLAFTWTGRREAKILTRAEWLGLLPPLSGDALLSGFYVNELVVRLTEREDVHFGLFRSYVRALEALSDPRPAERQIGLRRFEAALLAACGWGVSVIDGGSAERFALTPDGALLGLTGAAEAEALARGDALWPRAAALAVASRRREDFAALSPRDMRSARELLRAAVDLRLDGRPLRSRRVLGDLKAL